MALHLPVLSAITKSSGGQEDCLFLRRNSAVVPPHKKQRWS